MTIDDAVGLAIAEANAGSSHTTAMGYTNPYGAQCVAFIAWLAERLGYTKPIMPGYNAIDVFTKNPLGLPKPANPDPGDFFFLYYAGYGHTGFVTRVVATGFWGVSQNYRAGDLDKGGPATLDFYPFDGKLKVAGYLRPTFTQGGEMNPTEQDIRNIIPKLWGRQPNATDIAAFTSKTWKEFFYDAVTAYPFTDRQQWFADAEARKNELEQIVADYEKAAASKPAPVIELKPGTYQVK